MHFFILASFASFDYYALFFGGILTITLTHLGSLLLNAHAITYLKYLEPLTMYNQLLTLKCMNFTSNTCSFSVMFL